MKWLVRFAASLALVTPSCAQRPPDSPALATYGITGTVISEGTGAGLADVVLHLEGAGTASTATDDTGSYAFTGLPDGNYTISPARDGYEFIPDRIAVTVNGGNFTGQDFTASVPWLAVASHSTSQLTSVWASGANDVWVVGREPPAILHWNGGTWSAATLPAGVANFYGLWGSGARDVWVVGSGVILRWDGSTWSLVEGEGTHQTVWASIWGSGAEDAWMVGQFGNIEHWDGQAWVAVTNVTPNMLTGVWGSAADDVWAVGLSGTIVHWDGHIWSSVESGTATNLYDVWGSGPDSVWAVGLSGTIVHWDGGAWSAVESVTTNNLTDVWGSGPSSVWAVGAAGTILHWDGRAWSSVESGTTVQFDGVGGIGSSDVWVTGESGTILRRQEPQ